MASVPTKLMSFAEFEQLPEHSFGRRQELRHGELIELAPPQLNHWLIQRRLRQLLETASGDRGIVDIELGFRPAPDLEFRIADVVFVSSSRLSESGDYLCRAPELVIEVLSPSNTAAELL